MPEVHRLADQLVRAIEGGAWHGPSLLELLEGLSGREASARPQPGAHSIWEIVRHLTTWHDVARQRLEGVPVEPTDEDDWPPIGDSSDAAWSHAVARLHRTGLLLADAVRGLDDDALERPTPGTSYTLYVLLHGVVQHDLYHAGQIALLRRSLKR